MPIEQTLSIIKPDAVSKNHIGEIVARFEKAGLTIEFQRENRCFQREKDLKRKGLQEKRKMEQSVFLAKLFLVSL